MNRLLHQVAAAIRAPTDRTRRRLAWRTARASRRISRPVRLSLLLLAKRLAEQPALPAGPHWPPAPDLSKTIPSEVVAALKPVHGAPPGLFGTFAQLISRAGGNRRYWRLR